MNGPAPSPSFGDKKPMLTPSEALKNLVSRNPKVANMLDNRAKELAQHGISDKMLDRLLGDPKVINVLRARAEELAQEPTRGEAEPVGHYTEAKQHELVRDKDGNWIRKEYL